MTVARTIDLPARISSPGSTQRLAGAARAALGVAITVLVLLLLGSAAYSWGGIAEGNPDPTLWTD